MTIEVLRSLERIIGVLIGGLAIYLGFRLFLALPKKTDGTGKLVLPGGISIYLSRLGPGAFFAMFGCALVLISFRQAVTMERVRWTGGATNVVTGLASPGPEGERSGYHGLGGGNGLSTEEQRVRLIEARVALADLNRLGYPLLTNLPVNERRQLRNALERGRLALVQAVWEPGWGDFAGFEQWVREGQTQSLPDSRLADARDLFNHGQPGNAP